MKIEVESLMRKAAANGLSEYQPIFRGEPLEVEAGEPKASLDNLRKMIKEGLEVQSVLVVEDANVLVVFKTGETYLATGFDIGDDSVATKSFAEFLEFGLGYTTQVDWFNLLEAQDRLFKGPIDPTRIMPPSRQRPRIMRDQSPI